MANKKTKREFFGELREMVVDNKELVAFIDHEIELLDNKKNSKTTTVTQKENGELKTYIVAFLETTPNQMYTVTELIEKVPEFKDREPKLTNQKVSALCKQLVDNNEISKKTDKKKSLFYANPDRITE